jgi:hypothetical protein
MASSADLFDWHNLCGTVTSYSFNPKSLVKINKRPKTDQVGIPAQHNSAVDAREPADCTSIRVAHLDFWKSLGQWGGRDAAVADRAPEALRCIVC